MGAQCKQGLQLHTLGLPLLLAKLKNTPNLKPIFNKHSHMKNCSVAFT